MKKTSLRKVLIVGTLLLIIAFGIALSNISLVQADSGGVGKFLTIDFVGAGTVTATKPQSGEIRTYYSDDPTTCSQKVGAGTVELNAIPADGWEFSEWIGDVADPSSATTEYKTEKNDIVTVVFVRSTFTITASVSPYAYNGTISLVNDGEERKNWQFSVESGSNQQLWFNADPGNHISAIVENGAFLAPASSILLENIQQDYTIEVFFSQDGYAWVPSGTNVATYFTEAASLQFNDTTGGTTASGSSLVFPEGWAVFLWNIKTNATDADGNVTIALEFTGDAPSAVYRSESEEALYCDVNNDGVVDSTDNSLVAIAIKAYEEGSTNGKVVNPLYDTNRDGDLTQDDLLLIHEYYRTTFDSLEFTIVGNTIYIETDHFSIFRGR